MEKLIIADFLNSEEMYNIIRNVLNKGLIVCIYYTEFDIEPIKCFKTIDEFLKWEQEQVELRKKRHQLIEQIKKGI